MPEMSVESCLAKAAAMEQLAGLSGDPVNRTYYKRVG
ncbi:MAG: hypothetical protein JWM91_2758 [Rhodospirillales bacterium]|nr:hypothetical protein [Rhodospirillales bacterium]